MVELPSQEDPDYINKVLALRGKKAPIYPAPALQVDRSGKDLLKEVLNPVSPEEFERIVNFEKGMKADELIPIDKKPEYNSPIFINYKNSSRNMGLVVKIEPIRGIPSSGNKLNKTFRITTNRGTFEAVLKQNNKD